MTQEFLTIKKYSKFFTQKGWLTPYGFACGYMHLTEARLGRVYLSSNNPELNTFDVKVFPDDYSAPRVWDTLEGLPAARKRYVELCKLYAGTPARRARKPYEPKTMPATVYA